MGWGAEQFLEDWSEVVKVQNQATLDGSPVAQAIIKFMENKEEYTASSSEMHSKLKVVAAQIVVDVDRDKAWPKSARGCGGASRKCSRCSWLRASRRAEKTPRRLQR